MLKRALTILAVLLAVLCPVFSQGAKETAAVSSQNEALSSFSFTDSLGRSHTFEKEITKIAPSGNLAQMIIATVAPEKMVGLSSTINDKAMFYMPECMQDLPQFGTFYGKKANLNKEALIFAAPEVVIDMGEIKEGIDTDLDVLEDQIGIPVVFIESYLTNTAEAYRNLGKLIGEEEKTEKLAQYSEKALAKAEEAKKQIEKPVSVYYSSSPEGLDGIPTGNFHGEVIELIGAENVVPSTYSGGGNIISLEQLFIWDPDVILLAEESAYKTATTDPRWAELSAVKNNKVYLIPSSPYSFIDTPPGVNRIIGIYWLGSILYPELYSDIDLEKEVTTFYDLFYSYSLSSEELSELLNTRP